jgi:endonuclease IV
MSGRTNRIGRHLPISGGLRKTLEIAQELGCETAQIFVSNPQVSDRVATLTLVATPA